jgi:hypothetical protein
MGCQGNRHILGKIIFRVLLKKAFLRDRSKNVTMEIATYLLSDSASTPILHISNRRNSGSQNASCESHVTCEAMFFSKPETAL